MGFSARRQADGESAWCGWYLAVREAGTIAAGEAFEIVAGAARGRHRRAVPRSATAQGRLMLAYRHAFHAGNHADVLKHLVLMLVLRHMNAEGQAVPLRRHPRRRRRLLAARPLRAEEGRVRARHRPAVDARRPARRRSPITSRSCAASIPTACSRSTPARRRWRRCCCARRTSCARSSSIRPSRRSCARRSPASRRATVYDGDGFDRPARRSCRRRRGAAVV